MLGNYWPLFLSFALIVMVTSLGVIVFLKQKRENRADQMDNSSWLLIILLIVALMSISIFIAFIFPRGILG